MSSTVAGSGPIAEIIFKGLCCGQAQRVRLMDLFVNIDVNDLAKAIAFYERAVGVRVGRRFGSFGVEMLGATSPIYLLMKPDGTAPSGATSEVRRYQRHWTPVHLDFVVPDLDAAVDRAMEAGQRVKVKVRHIAGDASHPWPTHSATASASSSF
jgi:predicted enzyme related to lactoylglutathione lyase